MSGKIYRSISGKEFPSYIQAARDNYDLRHGKGQYALVKTEYTVKAGDNLTKIAKNLSTTVDDLVAMNPQIQNINLIRPGDVLTTSVKHPMQIRNVRDVRKSDDQSNKDNLTAIQSINHDRNYVVLDKKQGKLTVYNSNNKPVWSTSNIATGASKEDYNTITYQDAKGHIIDNAGNMSTPAGISRIASVGKDYGAPSFVRQRFVTGQQPDNIASSFHYGNTNSGSNGCVRMSKQDLKTLTSYIGVETPVYTLPEKPGSRFKVSDGHLSFVADNPYGNTEKGIKKSSTGKDMVYWDDYNTYINKDYTPLYIKPKSQNAGESEELKANRKKYTDAIIMNKKALQQRFGLTSDEYNRLAELAMGIADQETKFGTATSYNAKSRLGEEAVSFIKGVQARIKPKGGRNFYRGWNKGGILEALFAFAPRQASNNIMLIGSSSNDTASAWIKDTKNRGEKQAMSRGYAQIKNQGDSENLRNIYKELGIDNNTIKTPKGSALAAMARLAYMYNTEIKGRSFTGHNGVSVDPYDALLYKWQGKHKELSNHTATPGANRYIQNIRNYANQYDYYSIH